MRLKISVWSFFHWLAKKCTIWGKLWQKTKKKSNASYDAETEHPRLHFWRLPSICWMTVSCAQSLFSTLRAWRGSKWSCVAYSQLFPFLISLIRPKPREVVRDIWSSLSNCIYMFFNILRLISAISETSPFCPHTDTSLAAKFIQWCHRPRKKVPESHKGLGSGNNISCLAWKWKYCNKRFTIMFVYWTQCSKHST